jgi:hypothetical protein
MLFWTLQITIISIILIFLVHNLIIFFKSTLTVPKIKDLVNAPAQKYEHMYNTMSSRDYTDSLLPPEIGIFKPSASPVPDVKSMKDELKSFLKNKIKEDSGTSTIASLDSFSSSSSSGFANY